MRLDSTADRGSASPWLMPIGRPLWSPWAAGCRGSLAPYLW